MAKQRRPTFLFDQRGKDLFPDSPATAALLERRDQELEHYLWNPHEHTVTVTGPLQVISNAVFQVIEFDTVEYDPEELWSATTPTRLTVPINGIWHFESSCTFEAHATGTRLIIFRKNGAGGPLYRGQGGQASTDGRRTSVYFGRHVSMNVGDYMEVLVFQASGGDLDVEEIDNSPFFSATFISRRRRGNI